MNIDEIKDVINRALMILYRTEKEIINDETHEQTISARLMYHLQHLLPEWNVDVEFNRQGENRDSKTDESGIKRKPDIIIHKRGPAGPNLAVILVKCEWNSKSRANDVQIVSSIKNEHQYQTAFTLEIKKNIWLLNEVN